MKYTFKALCIVCNKDRIFEEIAVEKSNGIVVLQLVCKVCGKRLVLLVKKEEYKRVKDA